MISAPDRHRAVPLIHNAVVAGATANQACAELAINHRTYQRWTQEAAVKSDWRHKAERPVPANKLSPAERQQIMTTCSQSGYQSLPPSQIVPALADKAIDLASATSFSRVLREEGQRQRRRKTPAPLTVSKPLGYKATEPNQVWSWDITFLRTTITGQLLRLYLVLDIYSHKVVG